MTEFEKAMSDNQFVMLTWNNNSGFTAVNTSGRLLYSFYLAGPWLDVQSDTVNNSFTHQVTAPVKVIKYLIGPNLDKLTHGPFNTLEKALKVDPYQATEHLFTPIYIFAHNGDAAVAMYKYDYCKSSTWEKL